MTNNRKQQEKVYFSFLFNNLSKTRVWVFNKYKVTMTLAATQTKQKVQYKTEGCHINPPNKPPATNTNSTAIKITPLRERT